MKITVLTGEERDILVLGALKYGKQLTNIEIGQRLGIPADRVKRIIHRICIKLGAHNRNEAIFIALTQGELRLDELWSLDEIAERFSSLSPDMLRRIAQLARQGLEYEHLTWEEETITNLDRRGNTLLTKAEQDAIILAGCGLTNREIADRLYISVSSVKTYLHRACAKLGTHRRADAVELAVKQGELNISDIFSPAQLIQILAPLGGESIEKVAQLIDQKLGQEPSPTTS